MTNKDDIILDIQERLNNVFVNEFDLVKGALEDINNYLKAMEINYTYTYDIFCKEFLIMAQSLIEKMTTAELKNMDTFTFVQESIAIMIYQKIGELVGNEDDKKYKLLQHILIKKNV